MTLQSVNIQDVISLAKQAGEVIMDVYAKDFSVAFKSDSSPLTEADQKANAIIESGLHEINQRIGQVIPILSEEGKHITYEERQSWEAFWLVDPLDGTKEFVKKNDEFTVNIALIHHGIPILGVVYAPALAVCYWAKSGEGSFKDGQVLPLKSSADRSTFNIVASRSHMSEETQAFIDAIETAKPKDLISIGSSLKICLVAEGEADVYPRLGPTMEWDTGAAHAVVIYAGKSLQKFSLAQGYSEHLYNKPDLLNSWFVVQ